MSDFDFKDSGEAVIEGDWIVMKVAIPALTMIVEQSPDLCGIKVTNTRAFAADLVRAINEAAEDGTTPFHRMFDLAISMAINDGSEHVVDTGEPTCVAAPTAGVGAERGGCEMVDCPRQEPHTHEGRCLHENPGNGSCDNCRTAQERP